MISEDKYLKIKDMFKEIDSDLYRRLVFCDLKELSSYLEYVNVDNESVNNIYMVAKMLYLNLRERDLDLNGFRLRKAVSEVIFHHAINDLKRYMNVDGRCKNVALYHWDLITRVASDISEDVSKHIDTSIINSMVDFTNERSEGIND